MTRTPVPHARIPGIDGLRGVAVLTMAMGNMAMLVTWVPGWLKHAPDVGFTVADLVAPLFVVLSGFTLGPAIQRRRESRGLRGAFRWLVTRSLALIGVGALISAGQWVFMPPAPGIDPTWGVLQAIGTASLLTGSVILLSPRVRVLVGLGVLAGYEWLLDMSWLDTVRNSIHNGLLGSVAWGGLMILATAVADYSRAAGDHRRRIGFLVVVGVSSAGAALVLSLAFPIAKARASATYMLLSLSLLLYALFEAAFAPRPYTAMWLQRVGRHPLALYMSHLILLSPLTLIAIPALYVDAAPPVTIVEAAVLVLMLVAIAYALDHRSVSDGAPAGSPPAPVHSGRRLRLPVRPPAHR